MSKPSSKFDEGAYIQCYGEGFYVINDGYTTQNTNIKNVKLLAEYNLDVGYEYKDDGIAYNWVLIRNTGYGTGLQAYYAKGRTQAVINSLESCSNDKACKRSARKLIKNPTEFRKTWSFSEQGYSGSTVEKYVNNYKTLLEEQGIPVVSASLITQNELERLKCTYADGYDYHTCKHQYIATANIWVGTTAEWIYSTSYWTKEADAVNEGSGTIYGNYNKKGIWGVRPVIEIPKNAISRL